MAHTNVRTESSSAKLARFRRAIRDERLPCAVVDVDALDRNIDAVLAPVRANGKRLRVATKSLRCAGLIEHVVARGGEAISGLMTYDAAETEFLASLGHRDLLLAYPTVHTGDLARIARLNASGVLASIVVDSAEHLTHVAKAARHAETRIPVVVDVDVAYRPLGDVLHLGVRRSPLRGMYDVRTLTARIQETPELSFLGLMAYEAHIAGLGDDDNAAPWTSRAKRAMKLAARKHVEQTRRELSQEFTPRLFNGGGSGSLAWCSSESALTEVTAGSGFLASHLFDHYRDLKVEPAAYFALEVVRKPSSEFITCRGGGFVASGAAGKDRLPIPALPEGLSLLDMEGAGEVQTPLRVPHGAALELGDAVFFRHAKAGELAEHVSEYLFVRGDQIVKREKTYRGEGHCFLG